MGVGHGKLLLLGEHSAVYGHPALGLGTTDYTAIEIAVAPGEASRFGEAAPGAEDRTLVFPEYTIRVSGVPGHYLEAFAGVIERAIAGARNGGDDAWDTDEGTVSGRALSRTNEISVRVESPIAPEAGFGTSAALCVAIATELSRPDREWGHTPAVSAENGAGAPDKRSVWRAAHELEKLFHGTPSGIDTGLSLYGNVQAVFPNPPDIPTVSSVDLPALAIVYGSVPRTGNTKDLVGGIHAGMSRGSADVQRCIRDLGAISHEAIDGCGNGITAHEFGSLCASAHERLSRLGLSTDDLDARIESGRRAGALGGKLSGAGGGGAWFSLFDNDSAARDFVEKLGTTLAPAERATLRAIRAGGDRVSPLSGELPSR